MKIMFDSKEEIQEIADLLKEIYPMSVCLAPEDLLLVRSCLSADTANIPLPWDTDGFHLPLTPIMDTPEPPSQVVKVRKLAATREPYIVTIFLKA